MLDRVKSGVAILPSTHNGDRVGLCCGINSSYYFVWSFDTVNRRFLNKFELRLNSMPTFDLSLPDANYDVMIARFDSSSTAASPMFYTSAGEYAYIGRFDLKAKIMSQPLRYTFTKTSGATSVTIDLGKAYFVKSDRTIITLANAISAGKKVFIANSSDTTALPLGSTKAISSSSGNTITIPCSSSTTTTGTVNLYLTDYRSSIYVIDEYDESMLNFSMLLGFNMYGNRSSTGIKTFENSMYGIYLSANFTALDTEVINYVMSYNDSIHNDFVDMYYCGLNAHSALSASSVSNLVLNEDELFKTVCTGRKLNGATGVTAYADYVTNIANIQTADNRFYHLSKECSIHNENFSFGFSQLTTPSDVGAYYSILMYIRRYSII